MILTKEQIINLRNSDPHSYIMHLRNHEKDTWNTIMEFNDNDHFRDIKPFIKVYNYINGITEPPLCVVCGKPVKYSKTEQKYKKTCSEACRIKCPREKIGHYSEERKKEIVQKRKETNLKKYGTENPMQSDSVKEKARSTNLENHGGKWSNGREKAEKTMMKRYGVPHQSQLESVKEKTKKTLLEKYGSETTFGSRQIREKIKKTILNRYGVESIGSCKSISEKAKKTYMYKYTVVDKNGIEKIHEKRKNTCLHKYGVPCFFNTPGFAENTKKIFMDRYGTNIHPNSEKALKESVSSIVQKTYEKYKTIDEYTLITPKEEFVGICAKNKWKCNVCGNVFEVKGFRNFYPKCSCHNKKREQDELFDFVKSLCPDAIQNTRTILQNHTEIDVYVPSKKIGFEFDGLYWHSDLMKRKNDHLDKTKAAESLGIRLLHIFEDEWKNKNTIVKNKIRYMLNGSAINAIWARKCTVSKIDKDTAKKFLNKYHIQGSDYSTVCYGLYYGKYLVAVSTFTRTEHPKNTWVLSRYSTIASRRIVGGLGKIIAKFKIDFSPNKIRTFADRRYSNGKMYETLGFTKTKTTGPIYWYMDGKFAERIHRFNLRKDKLSKMTGFDKKEMTEMEMAKLAGFNRIYDCGQFVYEMDLNHEHERKQQ